MTNFEFWFWVFSYVFGVLGYYIFIAKFSPWRLFSKVSTSFAVVGLYGAIIACAMVMRVIRTFPKNPVAYYDTYYVVAHFQYVLVFFISFLLVAFAYFCLERWAKEHFLNWLGEVHLLVFTVGWALAYFSQFYLTLEGAPRRYNAYMDTFNIGLLLSKVGAYLVVLPLTMVLIVLGIAAFLKFRGKHKDKLPFTQHLLRKNE